MDSLLRFMTPILDPEPDFVAVEEESARKVVEGCFCNRLRAGPSADHQNGLLVIVELQLCRNGGIVAKTTNLPPGPDASFRDGLGTLRDCPFAGDCWEGSRSGILKVGRLKLQAWEKHA